MSNCEELRQDFKEIKNLKAELASEMETAKQGNGYLKFMNLKKEIEEAVKNLKEKLENRNAKEFNVLCVTKRNLENSIENWHIPITGVARVSNKKYTKEDGGEIIKEVATFLGKKHDVLYKRSGLNGTAVTIGIEVSDPPYSVWELYTDTPTNKKTTPEEIRKIADLTISNASRRG